MTALTQHMTQDERAAKTHATGDLLIRLLDWLAMGLERSRQRHALARLSDDQLRDIGLSRCDVANETEKPFWRV